MKILIVGGGKVIYFLCRTFVSKGYIVTVINRDHDECVRLSRRLKVTVVHGDGSDPQILEEAGAFTANAILAITPNDEDNLVICQLADLQFHIPRTLALVNDPDNEEVFRQLGIKTALSTTYILSSLIEQRASFDEITNLIPVGEGKVNVMELLLNENSPVVGQTLRDIAMPENSLVAVILRDDETIVPRGATVLQSADRLIVMTLPENYSQVLKKLTGESE
ncbi:MAG: TrkA family potassium uptake protein [Candidatus Marinimicrobia bacterium]|nr:TrkA family potassium uptake protein [Candidatus Neomarinimicrobiota bacterium]